MGKEFENKLGQKQKTKWEAMTECSEEEMTTQIPKAAMG